jgi:hypothetical protein
MRTGGQPGNPRRVDAAGPTAPLGDLSGIGGFLLPVSERELG